MLLRHSDIVVMLLKGQPGSGKSTLGRALAATLHWPLIDKDDARSPFQPLTSSQPDTDWNQLAYDVMFRYAETQLQCGLSLIVDCPLARRELFDRAAALAAQYGALLALVELEPADTQAWRRRVEQRGQQIRGTWDEHKPGSWGEVKAVLARNGGSEAWSLQADVPLRCRLDSTAGSTEQQVQEVLRMLASNGAGGAAAAAKAGPSARQLVDSTSFS